MGYNRSTSNNLIQYVKLDNSVITFNLSLQHTISKKCDLIFPQVNQILDCDFELNALYDEFITLMTDKVIDFEQLKDILPKIIELVDIHAEEFDFLKFSYTAPRKKSEYKLHIDKEGYLEIMKASIRSKFTCIPVSVLKDENMSIVRYIYNTICKEMIESGVQFKLERIIDSIVLSTSAKGLDSKSQLWVVFSTSKGIDPQNLALRERNAILYKGLPTIASGLNPVNWFVAMARTSIGFQMKDKVDEIHIAFNAPIESCYENSADMLKVFVYEEVTSNRKLMKLFKEFPFIKQMAKEYVYPITNWITAPFISKVFNVSNLNITNLINILLLNVFAYKFLKNEHPDWLLFKMLTLRAAIQQNNEDVTSSLKYPILDPKDGTPTGSFFTTRSLSSIIRTMIRDLKMTEYTIYTTDQLEELFKYSIKSLLSYDYYNYLGSKVIIDPNELSTQYIQYVYDILTNKYNSCIEKARLYFRGVIDD